uniref:Fibronectin type-II domain-containing protein n=2 Tax=Dunaliella tertiolecta TaxID=3047 RepID=A0A7S3R8I2_DUNTE|mmetsp:Transcript_25088/g.68151  ORF Transcript_25088/g.68151 Transcript_25088/m.68151 type:complete len:314 (-) Transcript_25088:242-1183(-)
MAIVSCNTGKSCAAPFEYQGKPAWSCVGVGIGSKPEYCTTVDGEWQQCAALVKNINRMTSAGDQCVLPFEFGGVGYYDCLGVDPATGNPGFCMNRAGRLVLCGPRPERYTTTGKLCRFPQRWAGMNVSDCVAGPLSQKVPACPTGRAGQWEACAPLYTRPEAEPNSTDITPKPASVVPGKPQSDTTSARSQPGGPASSSSTSTDSSRHRKKSNRQRDLILGLVLGLGGGILLLAITLGALRRAWAKRYHARVMKEMRMVPQGTTGASLELNAQPPQSPHSPNTGFFPPLPTSKRASLTSRPGAFYLSRQASGC